MDHATDRGPSASPADGPRPGVERVRAAIATAGAAVLGAAPHVLHHVGPLAGAALLAGATGRVVFGLLGFLLAIPMLAKLRRRSGSWAIPGAVLGVMAAAFVVSSTVIGPALTGETDPTHQPSPTTPADHESHHP